MEMSLYNAGVEKALLQTLLEIEREERRPGEVVKGSTMEEFCSLSNSRYNVLA